MNEQELKEKIIRIVLDTPITGIKIRGILGGEATANAIANALISEGIGDVSEWNHRAEVAELVVKNLNDTFTFDYQYVFEQAEKELQEERKNDNK